MDTSKDSLDQALYETRSILHFLSETLPLQCLRGVCHHHPNNPACARDRGCDNYDEGAGFFTGGIARPLVEASDYEWCFDCGALIWWAPSRSAAVTYTEMLIEPHTRSCWHTRKDPGGYEYVPFQEIR